VGAIKENFCERHAIWRIHAGKSGGPIYRGVEKLNKTFPLEYMIDISACLM